MTDSLKEIIKDLDIEQREHVLGFAEKLNKDIDVIIGGDMVSFLESLLSEEVADEQRDS